MGVLLRRPHVRRRMLALGSLVTIIGINAWGAPANTPWSSGLDLEPSLRSAALVVAVRVVDVSQIRIVYGGKGSETLYQYTFEPIRVLKGVYGRPRLVMTDADLRSYTSRFDPTEIRRGQRRLLLLGRSSVGYIGIHAGSTADSAFPPIEGRSDPLLTAAEALLAQQSLPDRGEIVTRLSDQLLETEGLGSVVLLAALDRRAFIAAHQAKAFEAAAHHLSSDNPRVREAAGRVLGNLLANEYLGNRLIREGAVTALVASLQQTGMPLSTRLAAFRALASAVEAVRGNDDALRLVALDVPDDTLAELAARLDIIGRLHENQGLVSAEEVATLLANLPLDAPDFFQRSATQSAARIGASNVVDRLLERFRRKKVLGLDGVVDVEAFGLIFPKATLPWSVQRALADVGLNDAEQEAFVKACDLSPSPELVSVLANMLDPRNRRLRRLAAELLIKIDTKAAASSLRQHLSAETDLAFKLRLAAFLGKHGFDDGYSYAVEHMSDLRHLEAAVTAISTISKPGSADQLLDIYRNSNDLNWMQAAVRGLGLLGYEAFNNELVTRTEDLSDPLAPAALQARADLGDAEVIELLPAALSSRSEAVAVAAAKAAATLLPGRVESHPTESNVLTALATLARDPDAIRNVRWHALEALVARDDTRLDDVLLAMVRDVRLEQTPTLTRVRKLLRERRVRM